MKTKTSTAVAFILLLALSLSAESLSKSEEAQILRQEIQKQRVILQALEEKLQALEKKNEDAFEISISEAGLQIGEKTVSHDKLEIELTQLPDETKILIRAKSSVPYKEVASLMQLCAKAGLHDIVFATQQAEPDGAGQPH